MLYDLNSFRGYEVLSINGKIGKVHDFYFSPDDWKIHYLMCDAGYQMMDRIVLFYTDAVSRIDIKNKMIFLNLDIDQIFSSPFISSEYNSISKNDLNSLHEYYGWYKYWQEKIKLNDVKRRIKKSTSASKGAIPEFETIKGLSCTREIINQIVTADTTEIGFISNLLMEAFSWEIMYILVERKKFKRGLKLIIKPAWIDRFKNSERKVHLYKNIDDVLGGPTIQVNQEITQETDKRLNKI